MGKSRAGNRIAVFLACGILAGYGCRESVRAPSPFEEMVEAERSFSRLSEESGVRAAFLTYLAEDAVVFRPRPVSGREWYSSAPPTDAVLTWEPLVADVSVAGDLGYTTGPWEMGEKGKAPNVFGDYVSVWRRGTGGVWQVIVDAGTVHPETPDVSVPELQVTSDRRQIGRTGDSSNGGSGANGVFPSAREFDDLCREDGVAAALRAFAGDEMRLLRPDAPPVMGKSAVLDSLSGQVGVADFQRIGGAAAESGDLAYVYGIRRWAGGADATDALESCLQIWFWEPVGGWKIAVDVAVPIPPPDEEGVE